ncbi:hypothetical protein ACFSE1_17600 [Rhizobium helianthi]|uniref:Secreted protein n=1 Tax=Rhizobium helianthi TaxID=1132695 RepID=A0ABW4M756_9HYPH
MAVVAEGVFALAGAAAAGFLSLSFSGGGGGVFFVVRGACPDTPETMFVPLVVILETQFQSQVTLRRIVFDMKPKIKWIRSG